MARFTQDESYNDPYAEDARRKALLVEMDNGAWANSTKATYVVGEVTFEV